MKEILQSGYLATRNALNQSKKEINQTINLWSAALKKYQPYKIDFEDVKNLIGNLIDVLIMYRQGEKLLNDLSANLTETKLSIDVLLKCFHEKLNAVHETLKYRIAIPTKKIFVSIINNASIRNKTNFCLSVFSQNSLS